MKGQRVKGLIPWKERKTPYFEDWEIPIAIEYQRQELIRMGKPLQREDYSRFEKGRKWKPEDYGSDYEEMTPLQRKRMRRKLRKKRAKEQDSGS